MRSADWDGVFRKFFAAYGVIHLWGLLAVGVYCVDRGPAPIFTISTYFWFSVAAIFLAAVYAWDPFSKR